MNGSGQAVASFSSPPGEQQLISSLAGRFPITPAEANGNLYSSQETPKALELGANQNNIFLPAVRGDSTILMMLTVAMLS